MIETPEQAYHTVETLSRLFEHAPPSLRTAAAHLALRVLLHPVLQPFRADPLRTLRGKFVSLDSLLLAFCSHLDKTGLLPGVAALLSPEDQEELALYLPGVASTLPVSLPQTLSAPSIGCICGALYVPALGTAVPCSIRAVRDRGMRTRWTDPLAVRPVGRQVQDTARAAQAAAVVTLERFLPLPEGLRPIRLYYDVCSPFLKDEALENVAGDSLGLPLTLAFLSVLLGVAVHPDAGATGAVGEEDAADTVRPVSHVPQKAAALAQHGVSRFVIPHDNPGGVQYVHEGAVRALLSGAKIYLTPRTRPPASLPEGEATAAAMLAVLPPSGEEWSPEMERLADNAIAASGGAIFSPATLPPATDQEPRCAYFDSVSAAEKAALSLRQVFLCHLWPDRRIPPLRMALHRGTTTFGKGSGRGPEIERLALLCEAAANGTTLLSAAFLAGRSGNDSNVTDLISLGTLRLRSLEPPTPLYALPFPGTRKPPELPRVLEPQRHNLPVLLQPRIGRKTEIEDVVGLLRNPGIRMVTLQGDGGLGKTRLALEVAARVALDYPDGVWFVPLTQARNGDDVALAVATALRLPGKALTGDLPRRVIQMLAARQALIILDSAEAARNGMPFVTSLLQGAPDITVLATSRIVLKVNGESHYPVPPLGYDSPENQDGEPLSESEAFFLARVRQALPGFAPTDADLASVAHICQLLNGTPLSLEIAAAQVRRPSLTDIETRLERALSPEDEEVTLLVRTLRWAYSLLTANQKRLFLRLAAFEEGFADEAAESVHDADARGDLIALEEASLVYRRPEGDTMRCYLLPPVQEFARYQMLHIETAPVRWEEAQEKHARCFQQLASRLFRHFNMLDAQAEIDALDTLDGELSNLRAALKYTKDHDIENFPAFVVHLSEHWRHRAHDHDLRYWTTTAVRLVNIGRPRTTPFLRSRLFRCRALEYMDLREYDRAEPHVIEALRAAEQAEHPGLLADMLNLQGLYLAGRRKYEEAMAVYQRARALFHDTDNLRGEITTLNNMGAAAVFMNNFADAFTIYDEVGRLCERSENRNGLLWALNNVGYALARQGKRDEAIERYNAAVDIGFEVRQVLILGQSLLNLGDLMEERGEVEEAVPILVHAEQLLLRVSHHYHEEAAAYLERAAAKYGRNRLAARRREAAGKSTDALLRTDPRPGRRLDLPPSGSQIESDEE